MDIALTQMLYGKYIEAKQIMHINVEDILEVRNSYTFHHSERVCEMVKIFCKIQIYFPTQCLLAEIASQVHDIGKISIHESILNKPGKLTPEEFEEIKRHSQIGADILLKADKNLKEVADVVLAHHERCDPA